MRVGQFKQTWADRGGIPILRFGSVLDGVLIHEGARSSNWVRRKGEIQDLLSLAEANRRNDKWAVVVGVEKNHKPRYALFISHTFMGLNQTSFTVPFSRVTLTFADGNKAQFEGRIPAQKLRVKLKGYTRNGYAYELENGDVITYPGAAIHKIVVQTLPADPGLPKTVEEQEPTE